MPRKAPWGALALLPILFLAATFGLPASAPVALSTPPTFSAAADVTPPAGPGASPPPSAAVSAASTAVPLPLSTLEVGSAPNGLGDLVALRRAEAASGNPGTAQAELSRPELRNSTNRMLLEEAGRVAEQVGDPGLAGELYARGAGFFGWTADRSRMYAEAAAAYEKAGRRDDAIEQYRTLLEAYGWTPAGQRAGAALDRLGGLTPFHRGLLAASAGRLDEAEAAFAVASAGGEYATAASNRLASLKESRAWSVAANSGTAADYRWIQDYYPNGPHAAEACFQEGFVYYQESAISTALAVWQRGSAAYEGEDRARMLLWAGIALGRLGRGDEMRAAWSRAAETHPLGYYALRARDLLAGVENWPHGVGLPGPSSAAEREEAELWLTSWAGAPRTAEPGDETRVRRAFGLLDLGLPAEAEAELNGLIADTRDGWLLYRIAGQAGERQMWSCSSRAAARVVALSPEWSVTEAPRGIQRLVYPPAFPDIVSMQAQQRGVDPLLLLSLMHQESRYDPFALSIADARGLSQVIPSTGRAIAPALGLQSFSPEDLYNPAVALRFGSYYLAEQLSAFGGNPFEALAAYNAGGSPVARWASPDPDLFVERIDYSETRSYVRQIYLHYSVYRSLASREGEAPAAAVHGFFVRRQGLGA